MSDDIPEDIERRVRQAVEAVIGALDGFKYLLSGFIELREAIMNDQEIQKFYSKEMLEDLRDTDIEELTNTVIALDSSVKTLNKLKSTEYLSLLKSAQSPLTNSPGKMALGLSKLKQFLEGRSTL